MSARAADAFALVCPRCGAVGYYSTLERRAEAERNHEIACPDCSCGLAVPRPRVPGAAGMDHVTEEPTFPTPTWTPSWDREPRPPEPEAWAWRCADMLPDSAQSRRDALGDAETLRRVAAGTETGNVAYLLYLADTKTPRGRNSLSCLLRKRPEAARHLCVEAAHAAFRACPELRS